MSATTYLVRTYDRCQKPLLRAGVIACAAPHNASIIRYWNRPPTADDHPPDDIENRTWAPMTESPPMHNAIHRRHQREPDHGHEPLKTMQR